jgi:hypothetical protein
MTRRVTFLAILGLAAATRLLALSNPPVGTAIDIHAGSYSTPEAEILVSVSATDDVGVTGYFISESSAAPTPGAFTAVSSAPSLDADIPYTIVGGYGKKVIYAWFIDVENNISQPLWYVLEYVDKMAVVDQVLLEGSVNTDSGVEVATGPAGKLYVTGFRFSNPFFGGGDRAYIAKYDPETLVREWQASVSSSTGVGTGLTQGTDIAVDGTGNSYTTGLDLVDVQGDTSYYDGFLVKYDTAGIQQWNEPISNDGERTVGYGVALGPSGNVFVVGYTSGTFPGETNAGGRDAFIAKYSSAGVLQWVTQFGTSESDYARDIAIDAAGNLYVVGDTGGPLFGESMLGGSYPRDIFLCKFNSSGVEQWTRLMGTERAPESGRKVKLVGGSLYVAGDAKDTCSCDTYDVFLAKYTVAGAEVWTRIFGGHTLNSAEHAFGLAVDATGVAYVVGSTWDDIDGNQHLGYYDLLVIKYAPDGTRLLSFTYATADSERAYGAAIAADGKLVVTGYSDGTLLGQTPQGYDDLLLMTIDLGSTPGGFFADGFESGDLSAWSAAVP